MDVSPECDPKNGRNSDFPSEVLAADFLNMTSILAVFALTVNQSQFVSKDRIWVIYPMDDNPELT